ncbi:MAG: hypothetical protein ACI9U2_004296, partial [Bradymonadia bacterium]
APGVLEAAASGVEGGGSALPHLDVIQRSFGHHAVGGVQAFVGGRAKTASDAIGAEAYATGNSVAFRAAPTLHTAAHEAAHVVQQRAGVQLSGGVGQVGDRYEQHADAVADQVVRGESAVQLLDQFAGGGAASRAVQKRDAGVDSEPGTELDAGVGPTAHVDDPCVQELGGSREYRSAGIASMAELEAYQAECAARAEAEMEGSLTADMTLKIVGGVIVVVVVVKKAVVGVARGVKRTSRVVWNSSLALLGDDEAMDVLLEMDDVNKELGRFLIDMVSQGYEFEQWATSPSGPIWQLIMGYCEAHIYALVQSGAYEYRHEIKEGVDAGAKAAVVHFGPRMLAKKLVAKPLVTLAMQTVIWAAASAAAGGSVGSLTAVAKTGWAKWGLAGVVMGLGALGVAEEVTEPRRRLAAEHPALFEAAAARDCAFIWRWIEPNLPKLQTAIHRTLSTMQGQ